MTKTSLDVPYTVLEMVRSFPVHRTVEHCGAEITVLPFDFYAECPQCGSRLKLRGFSAGTELEDLFDAVFEWMNQPGAEAVAERRRRRIADDNDE
ncbi:MAG: hypothetical protein ACREIV_07825 [Planctomycetaceae bacterium]